MKKFLILVLALGLIFTGVFGCATICKDGPAIKAKIVAAITILKPYVEQLAPFKDLMDYNAAYLTAKASLDALEALLTVVCPSEVETALILNNVDTVAVPVAHAALKKIKTLKLKPPVK
jgi:hypothetical protein